MMEMVLGFYEPSGNYNVSGILFAFGSSTLLTIVPAFGEEFGWRGYLLPQLLKKYSYRKALLLHGLVTWIWYLPVLIFMGTQTGNNLLFFIPVVLVASFIPTIMHAVVFAYIWNRTASLAVVSAYHVFFDEIRDTLENSVGLGFLGQNWQMLVLTVLGMLVLWKTKWKLVQETKVRPTDQGHG